MKALNLGLALLVGSLLTPSLVRADFILGRVRTTQVAKQLDQTDDDGKVIAVGAADFSAQKTDGKREFVSFTLTTDTKVMCFVAPCPVVKRTRNYRVESVSRKGNVTEYKAVEVPKSIAAGAFVGRQLFVTEDESTREIMITDSSRRNKNDVNYYEGTFEYLMVTM